MVEQVEGHLRSGEVDELSFMDHTPGQGQYRDIEIWRKSVRSDHELSNEEAAQIVAAQQVAPKLSFDQLKYLAGVARENGIALASHDDDSVEHLDLMRDLGCTMEKDYDNFVKFVLREQRLIQMSAKHVSDDDVRRYMTDLMTRAH